MQRRTLLSLGRVFTRLGQRLARNFVKCFTNSDVLMSPISRTHPSELDQRNLRDTAIKLRLLTGKELDKAAVPERA